MSTGPILAGLVCLESVVGPSGVQRFHRLVLAAMMVAACLFAGSLQAWAQPTDDGGKPSVGDKPKAKAKMLERYRVKFEVKDDAEWNIIQERIENVLRAQRELQSALNLTQQKNHSSSGKSSGDATKGNKHNGQVRASDEPSESDVRTLQQLVETRAPAQQVKPQLARVRDMLRAKQEKVANAREELRAVLSSRQEAIAVLNGLLR
jgi:hypothetical protein